MQKKILSKTAREYLQASLPENLFPIRKLRNTNKKLTFYKNRFSKIKVIRAKNEIFNQYASSIKNIFVKSAVINQKLLVAHAQLGQAFGEGRGHGGNLRYWPVTTEAGQGCFASKPGKGLVGPGRPGPEPAERAEAAGGR